MSRKRILFVGEDLVLWEQLQAPFPKTESTWDVAFAKSGLQALASLSLHARSSNPAARPRSFGPAPPRRYRRPAV